MSVSGCTAVIVQSPESGVRVRARVCVKSRGGSWQVRHLPHGERRDAAVFKSGAAVHPVGDIDHLRRETKQRVVNRGQLPLVGVGRAGGGCQPPVQIIERSADGGVV